MPNEADRCTRDLIERLQSHDVRSRNRNDRPNHWTSAPASLVSTSKVHSIAFGTGHGLFQSSVLPSIAAAKQEVIFVTCFWARSATLTDLADTLRSLSARGLHTGRKIRVRIGFSSCSLMQKLFHTRSISGRQYQPSEWQSVLRLPPLEQLQGLDLTIKSIFVLPFSVMHPKFVIVDRKHVLLPSCNVSWEEWFEGCMRLSGPIVRQFIDFYSHFWAGHDQTSFDVLLEADDGANEMPAIKPANGLLSSQDIALEDVLTILLPSPHHVNPRFAFPWMKHYHPPSTPLNIYLLALFARAERKIELQTPNVTASPVIDAIVSALQRGVDVSIITSERLMILEQLVTSGTTTRACIKRLIRSHRKLLDAYNMATFADPEAHVGLVMSPRIGRLQVQYYRPAAPSNTHPSEPVQSHMKLTIVDDRIMVVGSGNMDRASWYTSQELGVAFVSSNLVQSVKACWADALGDRTNTVYDGAVRTQSMH